MSASSATKEGNFINGEAEGAMVSTSAGPSSSTQQTNRLSFRHDTLKRIESLVMIGNYKSVEDFCEQAAQKEAESQVNEYRKLRQAKVSPPRRSK